MKKPPLFRYSLQVSCFAVILFFMNEQGAPDTFVISSIEQFTKL